MLSKRSSSYSLILIGLMMLISYSYFFQAGGWNQNSRLDLVRAIIIEQRLEIDSFHNNTGDKSKVGDHYYSDKAPGQSFLAVPFVAISRIILDIVAIEPDSKIGLTTQAYIATFFTSVIPTIVTAYLLYWLSLKMGFNHESSFFLMVAFSFATPAWVYATLFFPHALTACSLLISFCAVVAHSKVKNANSSFFLALLIGLSAGFTVLTEYHAGPAAVIIAAFLFLQLWISKSGYLFSSIIGLFLGAGICLVLLMSYNYLSFGSPFTLSYQVKVGFDEMQVGLFGITYPRLDSLWQLLFGQYRGLFPIAPVLIGSIYGYIVILKNKKNRLIGLAAFTISLYFILIHASFINWHGGWAYGPRYMLDALPFFCLGLSAIWMNAHRIVRAVFTALVIVGAVQSFVAVSVTPQAPQFYFQPFRDLYWPAFQHGEFSLNHQSYHEYEPEFPFLRHPEYGRYPKRAAWNVGEKLGLSGHFSMIPLYSFWVVILLLFSLGRYKNSKY